MIGQRRSDSNPVLQRDALCRRASLIHFTVDRRYFLDETLAVAVLQIQNVFQRPVQVIGNESYLLEQVVEGVAYDPPSSLTST